MERNQVMFQGKSLHIDRLWEVIQLRLGFWTKCFHPSFPYSPLQVMESLELVWNWRPLKWRIERSIGWYSCFWVLYTALQYSSKNGCAALWSTSTIMFVGCLAMYSGLISSWEVRTLLMISTYLFQCSSCLLIVGVYFIGCN